MRPRSAQDKAREAVAMLQGMQVAPTTARLPGATEASGDPMEPILPPTDLEFVRFQRLVHQESGIFLPESKRPLLVSRLQRRVRELGLRSFTAYYRHVTREGSAERAEMLDRICTNETRFFREPRQFDLLEELVVPRWRDWADQGRRARRLHVWSAGCSSGEEPYSVAMALLRQLPPSRGWSIEILATDLSTRALATARGGTYPIERRDEIPADCLATFMRRGTGRRSGTMTVTPEIRDVVRFERHNLCGEDGPIGRPFDLILCRNVLIYFDAETKARLIRRMLRQLAPDGLLFLGHSESLRSGQGLRSIGSMAYVREAAEAAWRGAP